MYFLNTVSNIFLAAGGYGYDPGCRQVSAHAGMPVWPRARKRAGLRLHCVDMKQRDAEYR